MAVSSIDTNLLNPDLFPSAGGLPHEAFDAWRAHDPAHWNPVDEQYGSPVRGLLMNKGFWVLTRYQDVFEVSRDQERFNSHDVGEVQRVRSIWFDAITKLPVRFTPERAAPAQ